MSTELFTISGESTDYGWGLTQDGKGIVVWKGDWFEILALDTKLAFTNVTVDTAVYPTVQAYWAAGTPTASGEPATIKFSGKIAEYGWATTQDGQGTVVWKGDWFQIYGLNTKLAFADATVDTAAYSDFQSYWAAEETGSAGSAAVTLAGEASDYGWSATQDGKGMVVWKGDWF
jgi:hypothetical protein